MKRTARYSANERAWLIVNRANTEDEALRMIICWGMCGGVWSRWLRNSVDGLVEREGGYYRRWEEM